MLHARSTVLPAVPSCLPCPAVVLQNEGASRDVLLLDIALDNYFRLCIERVDKGALSGGCSVVELLGGVGPGGVLVVTWCGVYKKWVGVGVLGSVNRLLL